MCRVTKMVFVVSNVHFILCKFRHHNPLQSRQERAQKPRHPFSVLRGVPRILAVQERRSAVRTTIVRGSSVLLHEQVVQKKFHAVLSCSQPYHNVRAFSDHSSFFNFCQGKWHWKTQVRAIVRNALKFVYNCSLSSNPVFDELPRWVPDGCAWVSNLSVSLWCKFQEHFLRTHSFVKFDIFVVDVFLDGST